ncbi:unnamed protein product [Trifolium pratense]|uniref:Uncharacterized protein n=1 Tax=Trifolium pratense TaxID=57577 RepID=A0ACB0JNH9_TRIPR|nr:unnamed protein product [Trifolium pratense]
MPAELARMNEDLELFNNDTNPHYFFMKKEVIKSRNKDLVQLFMSCIAAKHVYEAWNGSIKNFYLEEGWYLAFQLDAGHSSDCYPLCFICN